MMFPFLMIFLGQCVFAVIVVLVLKKMLDRELTKAGLEKFESCKMSPEIKEISVFSASVINDEFKRHIESIQKRKFAGTNLKFLENTDLKGGIVIALGDQLLDFSLSSRLQNFWS